MADLKELINQALERQGRQGGGHITAMQALLRKIEAEYGRDAIRRLQPGGSRPDSISGFRLIFQTVHPDLAKKVGNPHEYAAQLNAYKHGRGFVYNRDRKEWIDLWEGKK
ncbi:hypothetical protein [Thermococcus sp.]|uniref:hypothetical protein n=1 Tax=Thermococcus sp. TaxID=35749 RepID=UPI0026263F8C|nr:hypothetical protein [Thermococcus sp.]MCD6142960.1 hypothetical protein [Thermococcus sp.]